MNGSVCYGDLFRVPTIILTTLPDISIMMLKGDDPE